VQEEITFFLLPSSLFVLLSSLVMTLKRKERDENTTPFNEISLLVRSSSEQRSSKPKCDCEVRLKQQSTAKKEEIERDCEALLEIMYQQFRVMDQQDVDLVESSDDCKNLLELKRRLSKECEKIALYFDHHARSNNNTMNESENNLESTSSGGHSLMFFEVDLKIHVYELNEDGPGDEREDDDEIATYREYSLPCKEFSEYWDSLYFEDDTKNRLQRYAQTAMEFGNLNVDASLVAFNRVVLLHGPPGTGKTTMCKGLAQKLAVRMLKTYSDPTFVEINAHSLFSKWFSESGKLVGKLFEKIQELTDDEDTFVFILLDEVESLAAARKAAAGGSEPSDAIRVVNALLTQLDALKEKKNAMVLTTSNVTEAIDVAFIDRADVKIYVGNPGACAREQIILSWITELVRVGVVKKNGRDGFRELFNKLMNEVVTATAGMSGRALRKLPFLTLSRMNRSIGESVDCTIFLKCAVKQAITETKERETLD
jgi:pachytene checkpoint protein 2